MGIFEAKLAYERNPKLKTIKADYPGNCKINGLFNNGKWGDTKYPCCYLIKRLFRKNPQRAEKKADKFVPKLIPNSTFPFSSENIIVWLGHACFFICIDGVKILIDPCLSGGCLFIKRIVGLPCAIEEITNLDYLLISHNHFDHMESSTIKILQKNNPKMKALLPLQLGNDYPNSNQYPIQEAG